MLLVLLHICGKIVMGHDPIQVYAKAEALLNATLAYQAAIAVHQLKDFLGLHVKELHLSVAPYDPNHPSTVRVTCTIHTLEAESPIEISMTVDPSKALTGHVTPPSLRTDEDTH